MFHEKITPQQMSAWLVAALIPVSIQLSGGKWIWTGMGALLGLILAYVIWKKAVQPGKCKSLLLYIYVTILMGELLRYTVDSWPVGNNEPAVALILLLLAAWSAQKGLSSAARVGAVLFWVVLALYGIVFFAGMKNVHLEWLLPTWTDPDYLTVTLFLLPCAAASMLEGNARPGKQQWLMVSYVAAGAAITAGVLSPGVANELHNGFYEMSRSLELLGIARRFEALVCAGATVGWFTLLSLLLSLSGRYVYVICCRNGRGGIWLSASAAAIWMLCGLHIEPIILLSAGAVFWVVIPIITQGLEVEKKS